MAINVIVTDAGFSALLNAEASGTEKVKLTKIGFGSESYVPSQEQTELKNQFKIFDSEFGGEKDGNSIQISLRDASEDAYDVYEFGIYTDAGILFAVYSQETPILSKTEATVAMLYFEFFLKNGNPEYIELDPLIFDLNSATENREGIAEIATEAEAKAGTDDTRIITPKKLDAVIEGHDNIVHRSGVETIAGNKTFTNDITVNTTSPKVYVQQSGILKGNNPDTSKYMGVHFVDGAGKDTKNRLSCFETCYTANGNIQVFIGAYKPEQGATDVTGLYVIYPAGEAPYATAPTPSDINNKSTKIATTEWVQNHASAKYLALSGGTMTGAINFSGNTEQKISVDEHGDLIIGDTNTGALLRVRGNNSEDNPGGFQFRAQDSENTTYLIGKPDGTLTWMGKYVTLQGDCLPLMGGTMGGTIKFSVNNALAKSDATGGIQVCGGTSLVDGGSVLGYGMNYELNPEFKGALRLQATDGTKTYDTVLFPDGRMRLGNGAQLNFQDNEEQRIFIDTNGDLLVGDTNIGALLRVRGNNSEDNPGGFQFRAQDSKNTTYLIGKPDGTLTWMGKSLLTDEKGVGYPNYSAGVDIAAAYDDGSNTYTFTQDGWVFARAGTTKKYYINGGIVVQSSDSSQHANLIPVKAGDVLTGTGKASYGLIFYPNR